MNREWLVGIDIGGTFTDVVAVRPRDGVLRTAKVPSRPDNPVGALLDALFAVEVGHEAVENLVHGTTRITNAIVEGKLPPVALVTTAGFEDVLAIGRLRRRDLYRLDIPPKLDPLIPAGRTVGAVERLQVDGSVDTALTPQSVDEVVAAVSATGAPSVAVALLHAYANPVHEQALGAALKAVMSHVSLSHEINPEAREFERTSSTVLNAAAMPVVVDYLDGLLEQVPLHGRFQLFHSAGGWATPATVRERPLVMALSGPAAGVAACTRLSRAIDRRNLLTFDMGGTTTDVCLVVDGEAEVTDQREIAERPMRQPMVAIHSIGAGGGSIVRLGSGGLSVGPDSAGADPGPACYGRGGTEATVTDANAVLGYLNTSRRLGDAIAVDVSLAERALAPIAEALGRSVVETALGVVRVANATMARALRRVTVERGIDGRRCTLLAFGGAGPMHAVGLAREFGISEIVVPPVSSAFSAYGCLLADMAYTRQRTVNLPATEFPLQRFESLREAVVDELVEPFAEHGIDRDAVAVEHVALLRYEGQSSTVPVPFDMPLDLERLGAAFTARHEDLYGYSTAEPWLMEALRVRVSHPSSAAFTRAGAAVDAAMNADPESRSACWFSAAEVSETPRLARENLAAGESVAGPAIIEDAWSTVIVPPGWHCVVDEYANLLIAEDAT
jgi:N-methylhydantoinase A